MEHPRDIDTRLVDAQQARRVLDRLVGYKASPILWKTVKKGLSAGRVQTVALRMLVEREREIRAFKPQEYWTIAAAMEKDGQRFSARLHSVDEKKIEIHDEAHARAIVSDVERIARATARAAGMRAAFAFPLTEVKRRERRKNPSAPFTTSTLQQEAAKRLGFSSKRTMQIAQGLYEGVEVGDEGSSELRELLQCGLSSDPGRGILEAVQLQQHDGDAAAEPSQPGLFAGEDAVPVPRALGPGDRVGPAVGFPEQG